MSENGGSFQCWRSPTSPCAIAHTCGLCGVTDPGDPVNPSTGAYIALSGSASKARQFCDSDPHGVHWRSRIVLPAGGGVTT